MREGLYDSLLTTRLSRALNALAGVTAQTHALDEADAPARFAQFLAEEIRRLLDDLHGDERVEKQAVIVNELLAWLKERVESEDTDTVGADPGSLRYPPHAGASAPPADAARDVNAPHSSGQARSRTRARSGARVSRPCRCAR